MDKGAYNLWDLPTLQELQQSILSLLDEAILQSISIDLRFTEFVCPNLLFQTDNLLQTEFARTWEWSLVDKLTTFTAGDSTNWEEKL